jgi:hypothetical protein
MAYAIYFIKIQLMSERFEMTEEETRNVHKMANFIALFHTRPFIQSRLASLAPAVDLRYLSQMIWFKKKDETVGNVAIKSICNHLWYLTEELVVFSFFDESLPNALRESMVKQLLTFNRSKDFPPGKPKFPLINPDEIDYPNQLNLFVGAKSWLLFNLLNIDGEMLDWMQVPVVYWEKMSGYRKLKEIVSAFEVVNDCAERAIKMITDFKDATTNVEEQEFLLQVVEEYRKKFDVNSKSSLGKT